MQLMNSIFPVGKGSNQDLSSKSNDSSASAKKSDNKSNTQAQTQSRGEADTQAKSFKSELNAKTRNNSNRSVARENRAPVSNVSYEKAHHEQKTINNSEPKSHPSLNKKIDKLSHYNADLVDPLVRRSAIQGFMKNMNEEFGIEPLDILGAFSKLSTEELGLPPEQTINKVAQNLNLPPEQQALAQKHFAKMLENSESEKLSDYITSSDRQISLEVLSNRQARQNELTSSLEQMNQQFFSGNNKPLNSKLAQNNSGVDLNGLQKLNQPEKLNMLSEGSMAQANQVTSQAGKASDRKPLDALTQQSVLSSQNLNQKSEGSSSSAMGLGLGLGAGAAALKGLSDVGGSATAASTQGLSGLNVANTTNNVSSTVVNPLDELVNQSNLEIKSDPNLSTESLVHKLAMKSPELVQVNPALNPVNKYGMNAEVSKANLNSNVQSNTASTDLGLNQIQMVQGLSLNTDETNSESGNGEMLENGQGFSGLQQSKQNANVTKSEFQIPGMQKMNDLEQSQNVKDIVQQTRAMIKDGGGEIKMKLNPEGVGEVDLKVDMKDGKIKIDMLSDSPEVRKLLEKGMGDLKASLASQKLDVDLIKVDASNETAKEFENQQRDAERNFAQQFLGEFRQQNEAMKQGFDFDNRGFKDQIADESNNSEENEDTINKLKSKSNQRRLDLVA